MAFTNLSRRSFLAVAASGIVAGTLLGNVALADEAQETVELDTEEFDALVASGPIADDETIASSEWATKVKEAGVLRVGGVKTSTLFSLENIDDGHIRGFDAGLYQLLATYIFGSPNAYELTQVTSDTRESVLQNDQVDAVFATYSITPARQEVISFAGPYYTTQQGILVTSDNDDVTGVDDLNALIVAAQSGSTGPSILAEYAPDAVVEEYTTDEEARIALEQGTVDAYVIDATMQMSSIIKNPGKYKLAGEEFGPIDPYGIGLPLDSDGVDFVNGFLAAIEEAGIWADLWQVAIGDRTGLAEAPEPPAIGDAADDAEAAEGGAYADGTYEASGKGIGGDVPVTVTIEGGVITSVEVGDNGETQGIGSKAIEQLPALIVEAGGVEGVDGVSGASVTSKAIFTAVQAALDEAAA